ncbi:MAG: hypothetical protein WAX89_01230 [Alphaproteobacteria bacterium]
MSISAFLKAGEELIPVAHITRVDISDVENARVVLHHTHGVAVATGFFAFEALMVLKPSAMEGKRLRWQKHAWAVHNLIGHPVLQVLAFTANVLRWCRLPQRIYQPLFMWGMWVHDATVPRPLGVKTPQE